MSDQDKDQKTHAPSAKRLEDARKRGEVAIAPEVRHAAMLLAVLLAFYSLGRLAMARLAHLCAALWGAADRDLSAPGAASRLAQSLMGELALSLAPLFALFMGGALLALAAQGRFVIALARLKPQWGKLSPAKGLGRLLGKRALIEFAKTLGKLFLVGAAALWAAAPMLIGIDHLIGADVSAIALFTTGVVRRLVMAIAVLVMVLAALDFAWQRHAFTARMKMSLKDLKDEHKQQEGDPLVKSRIRAIAHSRARRRMMAAVPGAAVVITNPTHYAIALQYDHGQSVAPVVVAKGVDAVALKIREIAANAGVPVIESPPLARALHASVDIDQSIPVEYYAAVAEIIGLVLRLSREKQDAQRQN